MTTSSEGRAARKRRTPQQVRDEAVAAARRLLLRHGPDAITLKAVAAELGMAHGNLTHHFGTIGSLLATLAGSMAGELTARVELAVVRLRSGEAGAREVVDLVFDAFEEGGAGRLVAWLASTGQTGKLGPFFEAVARLTDALSDGEGGSSGDRETINRMIAAVLVPAVGAALIGPDLWRAIGGEAEGSRQLAREQLRALLGRAASPATGRDAGAGGG